MTQATQAPLWTWEALSEGLRGRAVPGPVIQSVGVDSRSIQAGGLFVALPGDPGARFNPSYRSDVDGHDYVAAAAAAGAAGAMVHRPAQTLGVADDFPLLQVEDTYDGLWALGRLSRQRFPGDVVAVTGSSGKTTAKHFISAALGAYAPPGSFNNHIGVPLSLANAPAQANSAVFEIGTNHPGEIEPLAQMVDAHVAVLLNVHRAHIENFPNMATLIEEKTSIFNPLRDKSKAVSEDSLGLDWGLTFGETDLADARITAVTGDTAIIRFQGRNLTARVPGGGVHRARTVAATLLVCHLLGRDLQAACDLPPDIIPKGRGNIQRIGDVLLVDDSYNANPSSMAAAIRSFEDLGHPGTKVAVIGEMLELGDESAQAHLDLAPLLRDVDKVICVGAGAQGLAEVLDCPWFDHAGHELLAAVRDSLAGAGSILVKGSNRVFWANKFVEQLSDALA